MDKEQSPAFKPLNLKFGSILDPELARLATAITQEAKDGESPLPPKMKLKSKLKLKVFKPKVSLTEKVENEKSVTSIASTSTDVLLADPTAVVIVPGKSSKSSSSPNVEKKPESGPERYDESDYSIDIASAVANILAEQDGNVSADEGIGGNNFPEDTTSTQSQASTTKWDSNCPVCAVAEWVTSKPSTGLKKKKSKQGLPKKKSKSSILGSKRSSSALALKLKNTSQTKEVTDTVVADLNENLVQQSEIAPRKSRHSLVNRVIPPAPLSKNANMVDVNVYLARIQSYFDKLGYMRQGEPAIRINSRMSMKHQTDTARQLIKAGEPIKCLHALILGIHFTNSVSVMERFTLNFRSIINGKEYKHVVLGIYMYGFFGAIGISRDKGLQNKPVIYPRLSDLVEEYKKSYTEAGHILNEVKIGNIITHDPYSFEHINFKAGVIGSKTGPLTDTSEADKIAKALRLRMGPACLKCMKAEVVSRPLNIPESRVSILAQFKLTLPNAKMIHVTKKPTKLPSRTSGGGTGTATPNNAAKSKTPTPAYVATPTNLSISAVSAVKKKAGQTTQQKISTVKLDPPT